MVRALVSGPYAEKGVRFSVMVGRRIHSAGVGAVGELSRLVSNGGRRAGGVRGGGVIFDFRFSIFDGQRPAERLARNRKSKIENRKLEASLPRPLSQPRRGHGPQSARTAPVPVQHPDVRQ